MSFAQLGAKVNPPERSSRMFLGLRAQDLQKFGKLLAAFLTGHPPFLLTIIFLDIISDFLVSM